MKYNNVKDKVKAYSYDGDINDTSLINFEDAARKIAEIDGNTTTKPEEGSIEERIWLNEITSVLSKTNFAVFHNGFSELQDVLKKIAGDEYEEYLSDKYEGQDSEDVEIELVSGNSTDFMKLFINKIAGLKDSLKNIEFLWINSDEYLERSSAIVENDRLRDKIQKKMKQLEEAIAKVEQLKREIAIYKGRIGSKDER